MELSIEKKDALAKFMAMPEGMAPDDWDKIDQQSCRWITQPAKYASLTIISSKNKYNLSFFDTAVIFYFEIFDKQLSPSKFFQVSFHQFV